MLLDIFQKASDIKFPVFSIGDFSEIYSEDNIDYIALKSGETRILDNKNLPGNLAERRFRLKNKYRFKSTIFNFLGIIKSKHKYFMDSEGKIFKYKKTTFVPLIYRKVKKKRFIDDEGYLLEFKGITYPYKVSGSFYKGEKYAGLLKIANTYLIYEFTNEAKRDTVRKV